MIKLLMKTVEVFLAVISITVVLLTHALMLAFPMDAGQMKAHAAVNLVAGLILLVVFYKAALSLFLGRLV